MASARVVVDAGYPVIDLRSVAWSLFSKRRVSLAKTCCLSCAVSRNVDVPVTADMEAGYAEAPEAVQNGDRHAGCGAVGANIEDCLRRRRAPDAGV